MQTTVNERIKYFYSEYLKMRQVDFSKKLRITKSAISNLDNGENAPSYRILESIVIHYPMLNGHWLLTGNGNMLLDSEKAINTSIQQNVNGNQANGVVNHQLQAPPQGDDELRREIAHLNQRISDLTEIVELQKKIINANNNNM